MNRNLSDTANRLLDEQLRDWSLAAGNYAALRGVKVREIALGDCIVKVQFNPARIASTGAKVDKKSIAKRPCFLCEANRPAEQAQVAVGDYLLLINPFPIFSRHFTIPVNAHVLQTVAGREADMARLAMAMDGYTVFYNGARCGASAPDHMHFQAGNSDFLPIHRWIDNAPATVVAEEGSDTISRPEGLPMPVLVIDAATAEGAGALLARTVDAMAPHLTPEDDTEPMMNLLTVRRGEGVRIIVIPRAQHRPSFYGSGEGQWLLSPASVDLGGVIITPVERDWEAIDADIIRRLIAETCISESMMDKICARFAGEPRVSVGIMAETSVSFMLDGDYRVKDAIATGRQQAEVSADGTAVVWNGDTYGRLTFAPVDESTAAFELDDVTIGVKFHWERKERQRFNGMLTLAAIDGKITVINDVRIEDYLLSVISSEMSANASLELLKAHAVISRSWLLAQIEKNKGIARSGEKYCTRTETDGERTVWYDREDHKHFDVCADDHCQRYQGIARATTPQVVEAIRATRGQVLVDNDGNLADARFSKCCGGVFEQFENCWEPTHYHYLDARRDGTDEDSFPDLTIERNAEDWILGRPTAFCNTADAAILSQVLNSYDRETTDFYRWKVELGREEIARLVRERSGIDFGDIIDLVPVARGTSGRLYRLEIVGTKRRMIIGKELEIRRTLSPSHLYSSAFVVERVNPDADGVPERIVLHGAGWGHGVGLCQIGAAVMGAKGYDYRTILLHYFIDAEITTLY